MTLDEIQEFATAATTDDATACAFEPFAADLVVKLVAVVRAAKEMHGYLPTASLLTDPAMDCARRFRAAIAALETP